MVELSSNASQVESHTTRDELEDPDIRMAIIGSRVACEAGFRERNGEITRDEFLDAYGWGQRVHALLA